MVKSVITLAIALVSHLSPAVTTEMSVKQLVSLLFMATSSIVQPGLLSRLEWSGNVDEIIRWLSQHHCCGLSLHAGQGGLHLSPTARQPQFSAVSAAAVDVGLSQTTSISPTISLASTRKAQLHTSFYSKSLLEERHPGKRTCSPSTNQSLINLRRRKIVI